jgi:hypothetical protein
MQARGGAWQARGDHTPGPAGRPSDGDGRPPAMRQQIFDPAGGLRRQPGQHVLEVGVRIVPVELRGVQQAHDRCRALNLRRAPGCNAAESLSCRLCSTWLPSITALSASTNGCNCTPHWPTQLASVQQRDGVAVRHSLEEKAAAPEHAAGPGATICLACRLSSSSQTRSQGWL